MELGEDEDRFERFIAPMTSKQTSRELHVSRTATDYPGLSQDAKGHLEPRTFSSVLDWTD